MTIPTNADVARLLNAAEPVSRPKSRPGFTAYVALCAFAGLRRGEALGVQVERHRLPRPHATGDATDPASQGLPMSQPARISWRPSPASP